MLPFNRAVDRFDSMLRRQINVEKSEESIKKLQSRYKQYWTQDVKRKLTKQKTSTTHQIKMMRNMKPIREPDVNAGACEG